MDEIIGGLIGIGLIGAGLAYFVYRWMFRMPKVADPNRLYDMIQYGACRSGHTGEHKPEITYPSEAAYKNDPLWTSPEGWHTVGRLVDSRSGEPRSGWTRTYAKDEKAIRRQED